MGGGYLVVSCNHKRQMNNKTLINILILIVIGTSCNNLEKELISVYHFRLFTTNSEEISDTTILTKKFKIFDNRTFEIYSEPGEDSLFNYAVDPLNELEERILFFNDTCKLVESKTYRLNGKEIEINKYNLDRENSEDEESYIYYNTEIGLIAVYNYSWFTFDYFDHISTIGLLDKMKSDNSGFIRKNKSGSS